MEISENPERVGRKPNAKFGNKKKNEIMKKLIGSILFISVLAVSCNKAGITPDDESISITQLPSSALSYIDNTYPDATISEALMVSESEAAYIAVLNTSEELAFSETGTYLGDGQDHHSGSKSGPKRGGKKDPRHHGNDKKKDRHCDSTGRDSLRHDTTLHHRKPHGKHFGKDSLHADILSYIASNYSGYSIIHAETSNECGLGAVTKVMLKSGNAEPVMLFFDASNAFAASGSRDLYANAPQAVKDYISANYSGFTPKVNGVKLTMADSSTQYVVFISNGSVFKSVRIQSDGTFVCEK